MDKHSLCKHKSPCLINALKGFVRGGLIGLGIRALIAILVGLFKRTLFKNPLVLLKIFSKENLRLVFFLSGSVGIHRSVLCALRRFTNDEKISSFFAGFMGAIPLAIEDSESRIMYALYVLARSLDTICKYLVHHKYVREIPYFLEICYMMAIGSNHYIRVWNPECLNRGYYNLLNRFLREPNDPIYLDMIGTTDKFLLKRNK